jgi:hypothetical protein
MSTQMSRACARARRSVPDVAFLVIKQRSSPSGSDRRARSPVPTCRTLHMDPGRNTPWVADQRPNSHIQGYQREITAVPEHRVRMVALAGNEARTTFDQRGSRHV